MITDFKANSLREQLQVRRCTADRHVVVVKETAGSRYRPFLSELLIILSKGSICFADNDLFSLWTPTNCDIVQTNK